MKTLTVLFALLLVGSFLAVAPPARAELLIQDESSVSGSAREFYLIGAHRPDGSCESVEVYADTLSDAMRMVKERRCDSCVLEDLTSKMRASMGDLRHQLANYCPLW